MHDNSDSTDRGREEFLLFAIAFLGFVGAMGGMVKKRRRKGKREVGRAEL